jgi:Helix-turn-helix
MHFTMGVSSYEMPGKTIHPTTLHGCAKGNAQKFKSAQGGSLTRAISHRLFALAGADHCRSRRHGETNGHTEAGERPHQAHDAIGSVAADAGIYQELVSRIENGAANPELDTLGKIADALGVQPRDLFEE